MAQNSLFCADVPLSNYSLTHTTEDVRCVISASEMTFIVSGGALNSTHSLTRCVIYVDQSKINGL